MKKHLTGTVIKTQMEKTLVVEVETVKQHPVYGKRVRRQKKYFVHDENETAKIGDVVIIAESKPISKLKKWNFIEVLNI